MKKMSQKQLEKELNEVQKDPKFMKEIDTFIKASMRVHKLK